MFFRQVLYRDLGCASYMLGDSGEAVVVDPRWDIEVYLETARAERLRIAHVIETHDHADHVSGRFRLAEATGARCHRAAIGEPDRADVISARDEIAVGSLRLRAVGTPGHRPEHLSFAVTDVSRGSDPWMLLTGDSLLVGDLARPDLAVDAVDGAATLHASLEPLLSFEDYVEVWPAHVGGSLCGGAGLSGKTNSTIGFERLHNPLLMMPEAMFVKALLQSLPTRPPNIGRIVSLNSARSGGAPVEPGLLTPRALRIALRDGATVLDSRMPPEFDGGHLGGSVNLPVASPGVGTRAGWVLEPAAPIVIVAEGAGQATAMASALHAVGLWQTVGYALADASAWARHELPVAHAHSWDLEQLAARLQRDTVDLVDVRESSEWVTGHVPGSHHMPLRSFRVGREVELPKRGRTTAVACAAGVRAAFAASLLRRAGRPDVVRVAGGGVPDLSRHGIGLEIGLD